MDTNYDASRRLRRFWLLISLLAVLFTGVTAASAQVARPNGRIAFISNRDGNFEIYIANNDGSEQTRLTNTPEASEYAPSWSPNGRNLAFVSNTAGDRVLKVITAEGSNQTVLTSINPSPNKIDSSLSWSPDGSKIAFSSGGDICTINLDGTGLINLTNTGIEDGQPAWSPDGTKIAFSTFNYFPDKQRINVMNADGSNVRPYNNSVYDFVYQPKWSPDGQRLAYLAMTGADGDFDVHLMVGTPTGEVTVSQCCTFWFDWAPDGTRFLVEYSSPRDSQRGIFTMDETGATPMLVIPGAVYTPDWEPSASALPGNGKIAFASHRDGNSEIYLMNNDGSNPIRLTNSPGVDDFPTWSPDGRRIAYISQNAGGQYEIKLMNADGTAQSRLTTLTLDGSCTQYCLGQGITWSPLGTKIAFTDGFGSNLEIFTINTDGSNRVNVTNNPAHDLEPSWSPDGNRVLFVSTRVVSPGSFMIMHTMNVDGSDVRALPSEGESWDQSPSWSPTGGKITFVAYSESFMSILYIANSDGTNRQPFDTCDPGFCDTNRFDPRWSPDSTKIAFSIETSFTRVSEIYVKNVDDPGSRTQLTFTNGRNVHPAWQPLVTQTCANPIDCADFFLRQQYLDFLGREPDAAGFAGWQNVMNNCGNTVSQPCDRIEVSSAFFRSPEFQGRGYFIYRFYSAVGKIPVYEEFMPDFARVSGFLTDQQLETNKAAFVSEFMARSEFAAKYGSTFSNPPEYVQALLRTVDLPNHPSRIGWIALLHGNNNAQNRATVLRQLIESAELYNKYFNESFVIMQYFGFLRRTADASYLKWIQTMNDTGGDYRIMINGFLNSTEYRHRFGP